MFLNEVINEMFTQITVESQLSNWGVTVKRSGAVAAAASTSINSFDSSKI